MPYSKIQPPDIFHLSAAVGWLELGNPIEAAAELDQLSTSVRSHPDVLEVCWQISAEQKNWDACRDVALALTRADPGSHCWLDQPRLRGPARIRRHAGTGRQNPCWHRR
jgi:hypothetical protein